MISYRNARQSDMHEVAKVHIATQPEYFTTTLGADLLAKFYTEFLIEDDLFIVACDSNKNGRIIGFCMGNYYGSSAEKRWEQKYRNQIIRRLFLKSILLNRLAISRSFRRVTALVKRIISSNKSEINTVEYDWHLLSLGVLSEYRGRHIASTLISEFEKKCLLNPPRNLVKRNCTIGAYKWNVAGCKLYEYKGYQVFEETKEKLKYTKDLK